MKVQVAFGNTNRRYSSLNSMDYKAKRFSALHGSGTTSTASLAVRSRGNEGCFLK